MMSLSTATEFVSYLFSNWLDEVINVLIPRFMGHVPRDSGYRKGESIDE